MRALLAKLSTLACGLLLAAEVTAAECVFPDNVNWVVATSCEISGVRIAPRSLLVQGNAVLTIEPAGRLIIDTRTFRVRVEPEARISIRPGGRIRANQIGPRMVRLTDGGSIGYYLKQVDGPVLYAFNSNLSFHPSSTIKTLYLVEALRQVDQGTLTLAGTQLALCPSPIVAAPAGTTTCPNSFQSNDGTTGAGGAGGNCATGPAVANNNTNCGGTTVSRPLGVSICAMMKVSNNQTSNAIQEIIGAGDPQVGWAQMLSGAGAVVGLTATSFANRMGCGGPNNTPNNQTTLRDLGRLFEEMVSDPAVLFPSNPPANFAFVNTNAYAFMDNDSNVGGDALIAPLQAVINEQIGELGIAAVPGAAFRNAVRFVHKRGSNLTKDMNGDGVQDVFDPRDYRTMAGWLSLPIEGGAATREYVFGLFFNDIDATSSIRTLLNDAPEMFRPIIRDALRDF